MSSIGSTSTTPTGMTGAGGGNMIRITGMATGLDVDSMVKKMMASEQTKIDKVKQAQQITQWQQDAYTDIINSVKDLQNTYFNSTSPDSLLNPSNYSAFDIASSIPTIATATANTGAAVGTYDVTVNSLAKAASISGNSLISQVTYSDASINNWKNSIITFNDGTGDTPFTIPDGVTSGTDIVSNLNQQISGSSLAGKVSASYVDDGTNKYIKFNNLSGSNITVKGDGTNFSTSAINVVSRSTSTKLSDLDPALKNASGSPLSLTLKYNGTSKTVTLDNSSGTKTIADLMSEISNQTGGNVTALFDQMSGKFTLQTKNTGSTSTLSIDSSSSTAGLLTDLGSLPTSIAQGQDAIVTITPPGGTATTLTESSNNFTINNIKYSITKAGNTTLTVTSDVDTVFNRIKGFMDKYNALISKISTALTEKKNYDYPPLTDAQKSQMKDSDITAWNDKAKQGVLKNDIRLQKLLQDLRSTFYDSFSTNPPINFGDKDIGIDMSNDSSKAGQIVFDELKGPQVGEQTLKDALTNRGADIMSLFVKLPPAGSVSITDSNYYSTTYKNEGIMNRISDILTNNVDAAGLTVTGDTHGILNKYANLQDDFSLLGSVGTGTLLDQLYQQTLTIKQLNDEYSTKQEKYYQQFSQLETAMNTLNAQQAQLSAMLG